MQCWAPLYLNKQHSLCSFAISSGYESFAFNIVSRKSGLGGISSFDEENETDKASEAAAAA